MSLPAEDLEIDLAAALGGDREASHQQLTVWIPNKDRDGNEIGNQRYWVLAFSSLFSHIGGGATVTPPHEGGWHDEELDRIIWENPVIVYTFVKPEKFVEKLPELRRLLHRMGRETRQGEVVIAFDGEFIRIRDFDP